MKIDNQRTAESTLATRVEATAAAKPSSAGQAASTTDSAQISGDVELVNRAMTAAQSASDVRPDAVARAKALLDNGGVGQDLDRLANTMIDSMLS
jgi:anti-sigma28 factor (negative regulator of flagellin synthesis)